ncbi:hypothetical protein LOK74_13905 [Brevibacillus humidisoli]|uniref:anti-sigma factor family protein n=1 Tax=Brevibacillus humidisoli TaxID=2895522 RepID=UPI001E50EEFE|nr:hypothetical protein [Brevibacillus humidisoli]UFJ39163.1 hypothetical protein LOK74_13905 [Brevibacillus humidisoli]
MDRSHYRQTEWLAYLQGELTSKREEQLERHLYACDQCLEVYLAALEQTAPVELAANGSTDRDDQRFAEQVMAAIKQGKQEMAETVDRERSDRELSDPSPAVKPKVTSTHDRALYRHPLFHYAIAAMATICLMTAGIFQEVVARASQWNDRPVVEEERFSQQLMQKAVLLLDSIHLSEKRGDLRE